MSMEALQERIGYRFHDKALLERALIHSSYANESRQKIECNERMEFLGDAVLSIIVADHIFHKFHLAEGDLTRIRASLVCEKSLFEFAQKIQLGQELLLGHGEEQTGGRGKPSILADAMEAVIGAVFLDGGMGEAKRLVLHAVEGHIERAVRNVNTKDYKTLLQEHVQKQHQGNVTYDLIDTSGPDHQRVFTLQAVIAGEPKGVGSGGSKQEAGQRAAKAPLEGLGLL